jgi:SAM-dependent methyltransferase
MTPGVDPDATRLRWLRRHLRKIGPLRSAWSLAWELKDVLQADAAYEREFTDVFAAGRDPFRYETNPIEQTRFDKALELLDAVRGAARFGHVLEVGCAEGVFTERLAARCAQLVAVDFMPLALERAQARCRAHPNISFGRWDIRREPVPGRFDVIVLTDVLSCFNRPTHTRRARNKLVDALAPGGYLLFGDYLGPPDLQQVRDVWWARWLLRGGRAIDRHVAAHPALVEIGHAETATHVLTLLRKRG